MEPLSATLTFISLATTLSSLIDLAVNLRDSFQKISRNRQDAKRLATDIVTNLQQLQEFYKEHSEVLDNSISMKTAVCNLQREMHSVYSKCCSLTPNAGTKKVVQWHKVITAFNSWVNRTKVEEEIKDLKTHVMLCYIQFTTFATARIEVSTQKIYDVSMKLENHLMWTNRSTILGLQKIEGDFSQTDMCDVSNQSITLRANISNTYQRASANAADTYLCSEIAIIDQTLTALSKAMIYPTKDKVGPYQKPFRPIIHIKPISTDPDTHRRDVIMKTLDVLQVLHNNNNNNNNPSHSHSHSLALPFHQGGWGLVNLCIGLYQIGCYHEAILIGVWAVKLFRILADADEDPNAYYPYLALSLHNLSHYYIADGNEKEAVDCVTECLEIGRMLNQRDPTPEVRGLLVRSLVSSARISAAAKDYQRSFEESREAVRISEDILNRLLDRKPNDILLEELLPSSDLDDGTIQHAIPQLQMSSLSSSSVFSEEVNGVISQTLHGYGQALHQLSSSLHRHGRFLEAIAADTKALQVFRLISLHNTSLFETDIVEIISSLTHKDFRVFIPHETSLAYIQESITIYRRLSDSTNGSNSLSASKSLYDALYTQATMLRAMERYTEELEAWNEVVNMGRSIRDFVLIANALYQKGWTFRHLHRFTDAAASRMEAVKAYRMAFQEVQNQLEANAHYEIAVDLELADLSDQARVAAQEAVNQYRVLVLTGHESSTTTEALADSLTLLANISLRRLDFECATEKGEEALRLYQAIRIRLRSQTQTPEPDYVYDITSKYADCLDINMTAAFESNDEGRAVERGFLVVQLFEELSISLSVHHDHTLADGDGVALNLGLVGSWETYGLLLNKHDRLAEARPWMEKALDWYKAHSAGDFQAGYIAALCIYGCILDDQGFPEQALSQVETAVSLAKDRCLVDSNSNPSFVSLYCISTAHQIDHLLELGRYREALAISKDLVTYVRQGGLTDVRDVVECFLVHATTLNCNNEHEAAISISNEAIALSQTHLKSSLMSQAQRDKDQVQLAYALYVLSESLADCGRENEAEALVYARRCVDQIHELQTRFPALGSPRMRYVSALFSTNLACRLAASASASTSTSAAASASGANYQTSINLLTQVKTFYETSIHSRNGYSIELARVYRLLGLLHCAQGQHEEGVTAFAALTDLRKRLMEETPDLARYVDIHLQREEKRPSSWLWLNSLHSKLGCSHQPSLFHLLR